ARPTVSSCRFRDDRHLRVRCATARHCAVFLSIPDGPYWLHCGIRKRTHCRSGLSVRAWLWREKSVRASGLSVWHVRHRKNDLQKETTADTPIPSACCLHPLTIHSHPLFLQANGVPRFFAGKTRLWSQASSRGEDQEGEGEACRRHR